MLRKKYYIDDDNFYQLSDEEIYNLLKEEPISLRLRFLAHFNFNKGRFITSMEIESTGVINKTDGVTHFEEVVVETQEIDEQMLYSEDENQMNYRSDELHHVFDHSYIYSSDGQNQTLYTVNDGIENNADVQQSAGCNEAEVNNPLGIFVFCINKV